MRLSRFFEVLLVLPAMVAACAAQTPAPAQSFSTVFNFGEPNGAYPGYVSLAQGLDGDLYGTTTAYDYGTVFKMTPGGVVTTFYPFTYEDGTDPNAGLVLGTDGMFYGTTIIGGPSTACYGGCGSVFKITSHGVLTYLHSFGFADGANPSSALVEGTDGSFYGTTEYGGANVCAYTGTLGCGVIFKITSTGTLTVFHSFNGTDGLLPFGGLIEGVDGNFYGTTASGGAYASGTVFKITPEGALTTLYSFCAQTNCTDGQGPAAALVQGADGNFYGTTGAGGGQCDYSSGGTIFKITPRGVLTTLVDVCQGPTALIQATDGNLYGTTVSGGNGHNSYCTADFGTGCGTAFRVTTTGTFTLMHTFDWTDGGFPTGGMVQATNGILYGTTPSGGVNTSGTIYSESFGFAPFVVTLPTSRKAGQHVAILGTDLTGATSVTFNGTPAIFTVVSSAGISTTVPTGATTGPVVVTTPTSTLKSNKNFRIIN